MRFSCVAALTAEFPQSDKWSEEVYEVFLGEFSPFSVCERAAEAPPPYHTAAAPGPDCETESARGPEVQGWKREAGGEEWDEEDADVQCSIYLLYDIM